MKSLWKLLYSMLVVSMVFGNSVSYADWGWGHHDDRRYEHRGYRYHDGGWWFGGAVVSALIVGSIIESLPPRHDVVIINGYRYYYDGQYYYQDTPNGLSLIHI